MDEELYSVLNASQEEIKRAFRKLSVLYHPDKHYADEARRQAAEQIFRKIGLAHSILSSEESRRLYDELGMEAVQASWQLAPFTGAASDRSRIIEAIRTMNQKRMGSFETEGALVTTLDATTWIDDYSGVDLEWSDYVPSLAALSLTQSFEKYLLPETLLSATFTVASESGTGGGKIALGARHQLNAVTGIDAEVALGEQPALRVGASRILRENELATAHLHLHGGLPILQTTYARTLPFGLHGRLTLLAGGNNGIMTMVKKPSPEGDSAVSIALRSRQPPSASIVSFTKIDKSHYLGLKLVIDPDQKQSLSYGLTKIWSPAYQTEVSLECDMLSGLYFNLSVSHQSDYKLTVPIRLSREISAGSVALGTAISAVSSFVLDRFILEPVRSYWASLEYLMSKQEKDAGLAKAKEEALLAIEVMKPAYGNLPVGELEIAEATYKSDRVGHDVTIPLSMLVHKDHLFVEGGPNRSLSHLLGFYDVDPEHQKTLIIKYYFRGKLHIAQFYEHDSVAIPKRHHFEPEEVPNFSQPGDNSDYQ